MTYGSHGIFLNYAEIFSLRLLLYQFFTILDNQLDNLSNHYTQLIYFQGLPGPKGDKVNVLSVMFSVLYGTHAHTGCFVLFPIAVSQQADAF